VLVRFLKAKIDAQDRDAAMTLRGEVQVFQLALSRIGEKVPLGQRFGKMLSELLEAEMGEADEKLRQNCEKNDIWDHGVGPMTGLIGQQQFQLFPSRETSVSGGAGPSSGSLNGGATLVEVESPPEAHNLPPNGPQGSILPQLPPNPLDDLDGSLQGLESLLTMDNLGLSMGLPHTMSLGPDIGIDIDFGTFSHSSFSHQNLGSTTLV